MGLIDSSARVADGARIGADVEIGPYCIVGPNVELGDGVRLHPHVHIAGHTKIGARTVVYPFASLGSPPQSVHYHGGPTRLVIGADCDIREHVTMNTGTEDGGMETRIGDRCFLMVAVHIAHDCKVGSDVTMVNNVDARRALRGRRFHRDQTGSRRCISSCAMAGLVVRRRAGRIRQGPDPVLHGHGSSAARREPA